MFCLATDTGLTLVYDEAGIQTLIDHLKPLSRPLIVMEATGGPGATPGKPNSLPPVSPWQWSIHVLPFISLRRLAGSPRRTPLMANIGRGSHKM